MIRKAELSAILMIAGAFAGLRKRTDFPHFRLKRRALTTACGKRQIYRIHGMPLTVQADGQELPREEKIITAA